MHASCWFSWASRISVILWSWACAFYTMVFKIQWKPHFWLATQNYPLNDWAGWQFRVNYADVFAQAPLNISTDLSKTMHPTMCDLKVSSNNTDTHAHYKWLTGILIPSLRIKYIISSDPVRALWEHCVIRQSVQWCNIGHSSCSNAVEYRLLL